MSTTLPDVTHYTYRVSWSPEDQEFVAACLELPSLSWLAPTQDEALHGLRDLVDEAVLINGTVLRHGHPEEVLRPENLSRAFGLDPTHPDGLLGRADGPRRDGAETEVLS